MEPHWRIRIVYVMCEPFDIFTSFLFGISVWNRINVRWDDLIPTCRDHHVHFSYIGFK